jgi:succinate dehydrogenase/fumarate reductase flavoprotein subunit
LTNFVNGVIIEMVRKMAWILKRILGGGEKKELKKKKEELKKKKEELHKEEVKDVAKRLMKAYEYLLETRRTLAAAEEALQDAMIKNFERKTKGELEEDIKPRKERINELQKKVEEAAELVRLLEIEAKRKDPKFFDFL